MKIFLTYCFLLTFKILVLGQGNTTGINNGNPNAKAALDVKAMGRQGLLIPRHKVSLATDTTSFAAGINDKGLVFYDSLNAKFWYWTGAKWWNYGGGATASSSAIWVDSMAINAVFLKNASRQVGIGYTKPLLKLDVNGNVGISADSAFYIGGKRFLSTQPGGAGNVLLGYSAGEKLTTGYQNILIGESSGGTITTGYSNISIGYKSGSAGPLTGNNNIYIGTLAGSVNNNLANVFVGSSAGENNSGRGNVMLGYQAGQNSVGLDYSTLIGFMSGISASGDGLTFVGRYSGRANTSGISNTFVGESAGVTNTTGSNNTTIGANADVTDGTIVNASAIGYSAKVSASNSLVLGGIGAYLPNVGIGTPTPRALLNIMAPLAAGLTEVLRLSGGDGSTGSGPVVSFQNTFDANANGYPNWRLAEIGAEYMGSWGGDMVFKTNVVGSGSDSPVENMRLTNAGRLGIGTTAPSGKLHVSSATETYGVYSQLTGTGTGYGLYANTQTSAGTGYGVYATATTTGTGSRYGGYFNAWYGASSNYGVYGYGYGGVNAYGVYGTAGGGTTSNWAGYFAGDAYVSSQMGIGGATTFANANTSLQIGSGSGNNANIILNNGIAGTGTAFGLGFETGGTYRGTVGYSPVVNQDWFYIYGFGGNYNNMIIKNGRVGIMGEPTTYTFEVFGTAGKTSGTAWVNTSDRRLKKDILPIENALDTLKLLRPVNFRYNSIHDSLYKSEDGGKKIYGFIAQEYQKVFPNSVTKNNKNGFLNLDVSNLDPFLVRAVQEQQIQIEKLQKEKETLQHDLDLLKSENRSIFDQQQLRMEKIEADNAYFRKQLELLLLEAHGVANSK